MDNLLNHAQQIANQPPTPIAQSIEGRIAYVVSHAQSYASNGYAIRTHGIAKALNDHGLEVLCFVRPGRPWELQQEPFQIEPETVLEGVRYIHTRWLKNQVPQGEQAHLAASVKRLVTLFRIYRPSVVLAASNWINALPAWIAAKQLGLPFYNEVRGFWELSKEAREPGYRDQPAFKHEAERDTFVAKQAQGIFTLNAPMKAELIKRGIQPNRISIVPNAVSTLPTTNPTPAILKHKLGITDNETVVGYLGSFSAYEGLDVLIDACTELQQQGEKLKLLLVGDNQLLTLKKQSQDSAAHIANTGINSPHAWIIQVGRVPHDQVADYYALLDTVVIPRKPLEVCQLVPPMKAAEALAYGKRLVVSNVAPLAEYAEKYEGVVSFEAGNAASLAQALCTSLKQPTPKPTTALLFSAHTEGMVKVLKGEESATGQKAAVVELAKQNEGFAQKLGDKSQGESAEKEDIKYTQPFIESEIVNYCYGDAVYADGQGASTSFYDLSKENLTWSLEVDGYEEIDIFFNLKRDNADSSLIVLKDVVAKIEFYDKSSRILVPSNRIPKSPSVGSYVYLKFSVGCFTRLSLPVPSYAHQLRIKLIKWGVGKEVYVSNVAHHTVYKKGVSVVIPSYKGEGTLLECLDSLAAQTLAKTDFEVLIVLNGAPDGSVDIIENFRKENPDVNIVMTHNEVAGAGAARNYGISLSSREFITFVDDDDFISHSFLQGLMSYADQNKVIVSNIEDFNDSGFFESPINNQVKENSGREFTDYAKITSTITLNACKLLSTRYAKSIQYNNFLKSGEDVEYWTKLVCLFEPTFQCVEEKKGAIYYRRVRESSVSRQKESFEFNVKQRLEVVVELEKIATNKKMKNFVDSKVNAQLGFVNRYLDKKYEKWIEFKELADSMGVSSRAFQFVNERHSKTLVISYCFPPFIDTAGIVCAKRIIQSNKPVDVISNTMNRVRERDDSLWELVRPYIGMFHEVQAYPSFSNWKAIEDFCNKAMSFAEKYISKYTEIYSRSMWPGSHFAAALLKIKYPKLKWVAEFSDPLRVDIHGKERHAEMSADWLVKNGFYRKIEEGGFSIDSNARLFYWCEMLPYIFADEFIFTNDSQKAYMLNMLMDEGIKQRVKERSLVSQHPTLPSKYYNLSDYEYPLDDSKVNIGYFGSFYATRGIGDILNALDILPEKLKEMIRVHVFTPNPDAVNVNSKHQLNLHVNAILPYLEFLKVSKEFDALVVNDAETKEYKWINPYLPSKLSDYKGSGSPVLALFEQGSELSKFGAEQGIYHKCAIGDVESCSVILANLIGIKCKK